MDCALSKKFSRYRCFSIYVSVRVDIDEIAGPKASFSAAGVTFLHRRESCSLEVANILQEYRPFFTLYRLRVILKASAVFSPRTLTSLLIIFDGRPGFPYVRC